LTDCPDKSNINGIPVPGEIMAKPQPTPSILQQSIAVLTIMLLSQAAAWAQSSPLPDWSGVWERFEGNGGIFDPSTVEPKDGRAGSPGVRQFPPLTDAWEAKYRANLELAAKDRLPDPISRCGTPAGFPAEEMWPTFTGDSVGHWDGQALVFTTVGMIGDKHTVLDRSGLTLSDQAKVATRMFKTEEGLLRAELLIEDPLALREPWHVTRHFRKLQAGTRVYDYACAENNRNPITQSGQTLTLDTEGNVIDVAIDENPND
jgi:hypothetical protein